MPEEPTKSEKQKMLAGKLYDPLDWNWSEGGNVPGTCARISNGTREKDQESARRILKELFGEGGESVWMQPPFYCDYGSNISLGERVFFNFNIVVLDVCQVKIGDFTLFGPAVQIYTATHPMNAELRRKQKSGRAHRDQAACGLAWGNRLPRSEDRLEVGHRCRECGNQRHPGRRYCRWETMPCHQGDHGIEDFFIASHGFCICS